MSNETSKTRRLRWKEYELGILTGKGIDIGAGGDPATPEAMTFDLEQGDANHILDYIQERDFDYVYSSHTLEHMVDARAAIADWWQLVRPGGHLFLIVPDEDLYERGYWPSLNGDHRWSFTIAKSQSEYANSINLQDLVVALPGAELVSIGLQDDNYDRNNKVDDQTGNPDILAQIQCIVRKG